MGFQIYAAGVNLGPIKTSVGNVVIAFDIGVPLLYGLNSPFGAGSGVFSSSGSSGFYISNALTNGNDDTLLSGLDGQTISLNISGSPWVGYGNPLQIDFTVWAGTPAYQASRMVYGDGVYLGTGLKMTSILTSFDVQNDPFSNQVYQQILGSVGAPAGDDSQTPNQAYA
jgi:hypothetical protein